VKITKEDILDAAFEIVRKQGMESLNVRKLAKKLNCSVQPIYYQFKNFEGLQKALYEKIEKYFYAFLMEHINEDMPVYKQIGIHYIQFAKLEPKLFQILFLSETNLAISDFISRDNEDYNKVAKYVKVSTELNDDNLKDFHVKMWIFTHGLATLAANKTCQFSDEQIGKLLSYEFQALMLLEENPDNQWVLKNGKFMNKNKQ